MNPTVRIAVSTGLLGVALLFLQFRSAGEAVPLRLPLERFPIQVAEWRGREATILDAEDLNVLRVRDYIMRRYVDPANRSLLLYIAYWDSQRKGMAPHSPKNCLPGGGWEPLEASRLTIALAPPAQPIIVNRFIVQKERAVQVVLYWYQSQGQTIAGEVEAKVALVKNSILRHRTDGALVRVTSPVYGNITETSARLTEYIRALYPMLPNYLPE